MNQFPVEYLFFAGAVGLVGIGAAGMLLCRNLFRVLLALVIAEAGANLLLVLTGYRWDAVAPIILPGMVTGTNMVDPVPQALVLTAIVIGVGIQAFAVAVLIRIYRGYGSLDRRRLAAMLDRDMNDLAGVEAGRSPEAPAGKQPFPSPGQQENGS